MNEKSTIFIIITNIYIVKEIFNMNGKLLITANNTNIFIIFTI